MHRQHQRTWQQAYPEQGRPIGRPQARLRRLYPQILAREQGLLLSQLLVIP